MIAWRDAMGETRTASWKPFDYGVGAIIVLVVSVGVAAIVYSLALLSLDLLNLPAWVFGPLGVYTLAYSSIAGKESTYFGVWGVVMVAVAVIFGFYNIVNPIVILGILAILIAIIGIIAYQRNRK
jgi:hypothetical protein